MHRVLKNNTAKNITGLLLYANKNFMQVLEGERHVVEELVVKIRRNTRQNDIQVVVKIDIEAREFKQWFMGLHHLLQVDLALRTHIQSFFETGFDENGMRILADVALQEVEAGKQPAPSV
jgi:hypothetical protein